MGGKTDIHETLSTQDYAMCQCRVWDYNGQYENQVKPVKAQGPERGICETSQKIIIPAEGEPTVKIYKLYQKNEAP